jgi:hypothetical protein
MEVYEDMPFPFPTLTVDGIGRLSFPIADLEALTKAATLVPSMASRDTPSGVWKIDDSQIVIEKDNEWETYFKAIIELTCSRLGIRLWQMRDFNILTKMRGLTIYGNNKLFTPLDDEACHDPGTFATLLVHLPSKFEGGHMRLATPCSYWSITRNGLERGDNQFCCIAFTRDFKAEVQPVTKGTKVCLEFDLVSRRTKQFVLPGHATNIGTAIELQSVVTAWRTAGTGASRLGYRLRHEYTPQSFCFDAMKGRDSVVVQTLLNAKSPTGRPLFRVNLLLMERHVSRYSDYTEDVKKDEIRPVMVLGTDGNEIEEKEDWVMYMDKDVWMKPRDGFRSDNNEFIDIEDDDNEVNRKIKRRMFKELGKEVVEPHQGNSPGSVDQWYYAAAVVVSPMMDD